VTLQEFLARISEVEGRAAGVIPAAASASELELVRNQLIGRKSGALSALIRELPSLPADERREAGAAVNRAKASVEALLDTRASAFTATAPSVSGSDLTMPARRSWKGGKHPVTLVIEEIEEIFGELGFTVALGPEAETEWHNFTALNFPPDHPAMDMHDTLYLDDGVLLRTHTSPVQIRTLQAFQPPIRILAPGNVYRRDFFDASHAPVFAQI